MIMLAAYKKLDEPSLPPKEEFYSKLTGEGITDEDYQHAHTVWKEFNIVSTVNEELPQLIQSV